MSRGSPCMVEVYDQDNWVLFMLGSHCARLCDKRFGLAMGNAGVPFFFLRRNARMNDLQEV